MHQYKELKFWQRSRVFVKDIYAVTARFPSDERFGLTSQLRRAAVSIPVNIAEGAGRNTDPDFAKFLDVALGSATEVETLLILSADLDFIKPDQLAELSAELQEIQKMIHGFNRYLRGT